MEIDYDLHLTDFIDVKTLQKLQNAFEGLTGIAVAAVDANGAAVTERAGFCEFCQKYAKDGEEGHLHCGICSADGVEEVLKKGRFAIYNCYAGLVNFAVPIMAEGRLLGSLIGGQVFSGEPEDTFLEKLSGEIGADPKECEAAVKKIKIFSQEKINSAAQFLYTVADVLSDMAYHKNLVYRTNLELEKSMHMKSDFLANMSHEIRTPMNAVIGMAEMALREELPPAAKEHINQIKEAGKSLLTIINDILDFSKIESGKMDISVVDYEPISLIYDVANIVMTRLKGKKVELVLDISPTLPNKLSGDNIRIKQVLLNIAGNAAKFTFEGRILLKLDYIKTSSDEIELRIAVEDTGIGIKKTDIDKLFESFQQVDSKRNRNIEGTGLGLAISRHLLSLMNGSIQVESEYQKGSRFSFALPQKIVDETPCVSVREPSLILAAGLISNPYMNEGMQTDMAHLGVEYRTIHSVQELEGKTNGKKTFLFIESAMFTEEVKMYVKENQELTAVLIIDFFDDVKYDISNLLVMKKPVFALNIAVILNREELHFEDADSDDKGFDFIAPDAEVLLVDDNAVNLTVAEGLLEPLKMKIDTVMSGKAAIEKISKFRYDIIFMDHMMPELDGVETTHIIRRFHKEYENIPIIALTANAVEGTKEMFCREGMNDFVPKPIELRMLIGKVKKWLPPEKIKKTHGTLGVQKQAESGDIIVGDLNVAFAMKFLGSEELFWTILKVYYKSIEKKSKLIKELEEQENWPDYTIEVHALKSSSRQIGASALSEKAAALEKAGNAKDSVFIHRRTDEMLEQYRNYLAVLEPFCSDKKKESQKEAAEKKPIPDDVKKECFKDMRRAMDDLDMDGMAEVIQNMEQYSYKDRQQDLFERLKEAAEDIDVDRCEEILKEWDGEKNG